jgi:phosphatidylinositol alpha-1,6-mannosyltransferase
MIVLFTNEFPPFDGLRSKVGGIAVMTYEIARSLAAAGHPTTVVARADAVADREFDTRQPFRTIRVPLAGWKDVTTIRALRRSGLGAGDVVAAMNPEIAFLPVVVAGLRGGRAAVYAHGTDLLKARTRRRDFGLRYALRHAARVVANSRFTAGLLRARGVPEERIAVCFPGVSLPSPALPPEPRASRPGEFVLLSVGRLEPYKGHDRVIEALPLILREAPEAAYVVAGTGTQRRHLEEKARALGVGDRVRFLGFVGPAELEETYRSADVFVLPSRQDPSGGVEGFGIVFLEAGLRGLPVVAGRSGGVQDAVEDGRTGILIDPADPRAIAGAVLRLRRDSTLRRALGEAARERALRDFTWDKVAPRFLRAIGYTA